MRDAQPQAIFRRDYEPSAFLIRETNLDFQLYEDHSLVRSRLQIQRHTDADSDEPLVLHGQDMELLELAVAGRTLTLADYDLSEEELCIPGVPDSFELLCVTRIKPQENVSLEGLYKSHTMFCTQCEAEGFRKITYYLDRPDVMSVFTVRLEAELQRYPVLLSNGNLEEQGQEGERHWAEWHDPFAKPSYLFALVAGDLEFQQDSFTTCSGREVDLRIYVEAKDLDKCDHAMRSLQASMRWDEEVFGREYDLDVFNIVAVDDFNMGAMENKSLNIFNTSCVLANPATTTDAAFQHVEGVVAHEYFHNWSGNRVTCRDWFQLSLKEGFTVYRDAEFSSDMGSRTVKRIEDVAILRTAQFAEDAGPMAHPVRPDSFIEISNFYTVTIYEKGAEVVRMMRTLLGRDQFRAGSDLYFERHDGQAVTCDDFVNAMEAASGRDLTQFRRWYSQAGTPRLKVSAQWEEDSGSYTLTFAQSCPSTPDQQDKQPLVVPVEMGLIGEAGSLPLKLAGTEADTETDDNTSMVLELTEAEQSFTFTDLPECPVPSLLRSFSAPVKLEFPYSRDDLAVLMSRDDDGFCRWDACQQLAVAVIHDIEAGVEEVDAKLIQAFAGVLGNGALDPAIVAEMLRLPTVNYLVELTEQADLQAIYAARERVRLSIGRELQPLLLQRYHQLAVEAEYQPSAEQIAARSLRNTCLAYLASDSQVGIDLALNQFENASNMSDQQAALSAVVYNSDDELSERVLAAFYQQWQHESLVVNQWFHVQALSPRDGAIDRVRKLMQHADFDMNNPNKVRSVVGAFCSGNPLHFHAVDGSGYQLLGQIVAELDQKNPQIAARLLSPLTRWRRFSRGQDNMQAVLQSLADRELSRDVYEVVSKSLA